MRSQTEIYQHVERINEESLTFTPSFILSFRNGHLDGVECSSSKWLALSSIQNYKEKMDI
jgi:hypothetical protein